MTLIELQAGTAVDRAQVIGVKRADYNREPLARRSQSPGDTVRRTQVDCTFGRTYLVEVPYETVLELLNLTEEGTPKSTRCAHDNPVGWTCSGCKGPARPMDLTGHVCARCGHSAHDQKCGARAIDGGPCVCYGRLA